MPRGDLPTVLFTERKKTDIETKEHRLGEKDRRGEIDRQRKRESAPHSYVRQSQEDSMSIAGG